MKDLPHILRILAHNIGVEATLLYDCGHGDQFNILRGIELALEATAQTLEQEQKEEKP